MIRPTSGLVLVSLLLASVRPGSAQDRPPAPPPPVAPEGHIDAVSDIARMFVPAPDGPLDQLGIAGQSASGPAPVLTWERVYKLALIRAQADAPPRAEALDPARLDEQARRLGLDDFARARDRLAARGFRDPAADFLGLQVQLDRIATARASLIANERWLAVFQELTAGESFGLNDVDLARSSAAKDAARRDLAQAIAVYRDQLDRFKVALGLAPGAVVTVDLGPLDAFAATFANIDRWRAGPRRRAEDLTRILERLPALGDVAPDLRPALAEAEEAPERLEAALAAATRLALANRRDGDDPADDVELRVRRRVRHLLELRTEYALATRSLALSTHLADASVEQIIAPPSGTTPRSPVSAVAGLLDEARRAAAQRDLLVALWGEFRAERLALGRDLGTLEGTDWPSFLDQFHAGPPPGPLAPREPPPVEDRDVPVPPPAPALLPPLPPPPAPPASPPRTS